MTGFGPDTGNDGRFPDDCEVLVRYPPGRSPHRAGPGSLAGRETWPWLRGTIAGQCGPDEWLVTIEERSLAVLADGSPAPDGTPGDDLYFPQCFRDSSELRPAAGRQAGREAAP